MLAMAKAGILKPLVALLKNGVQDLSRSKAAFALANLVAHDPDQCTAAVDAGALQPLVALLREHEDGKKWAAYGLGFLAHGSEQRILQIAKAGALQPLAALLTDWTIGDKEVKEYVANALGELSQGSGGSGGEERKAQIAQLGALRPLVQLLMERSESTRDRASFALGLLAAGSEERCTQIVYAGAIQPLVALLKEGADAGTRSRAAFALASLCAANVSIDSSQLAEQRRAQVAAAGAVAPLVALLKKGGEDDRVVAARALRLLAAHSEGRRAQVVEALGTRVKLLMEGVERVD